MGACTAALLALVLLHAHLASRHGLEASTPLHDPLRDRRGAGGEGTPYWPRQAWRDAAACFVVLAIVVGLSARHGVSGPRAGIELGAPADTVEDPGTARPEWSFRGLYQLHETLGGWGWPERVSIFVIPGLTVLWFFAMPYIGRGRRPRAEYRLDPPRARRHGGAHLVVLYPRRQGREVSGRAADGGRQAERVKELAQSPQKIPVSGALTLLSRTPRPRPATVQSALCQLPRIQRPLRRHHRPEKPTAADLSGFASRPWLTEFLAAKGISSPKFFGNTRFKQKKMYGFSRRPSTISSPRRRNRWFRRSPRGRVEVAARCRRRRCERYCRRARSSSRRIAPIATPSIASRRHGQKGPDLSGYGSHDWLIAIVGNPAHKRFYGKENDRMPAFAESATDAKKNVLSRQELELLVDWLRGEWYEPEGK